MPDLRCRRCGLTRPGGADMGKSVAMGGGGTAVAARWIAIAMLVVGAIGAPPAIAADDAASLPLPRFASLRSDEVNLRTGPGERYPIEWVLTRRDMPVEIIAEFEHWRRIRDWQGAEGWVQERMIAGKREIIVKSAVRALHRAPDPGSAIIARVEPGVVARLLECQGVWCRIEAGDTTGWVQRSDVFGVYPNETVP